MKSTNKLKNYLESYTRERYFIDRVAQIRKDIGIPGNGIPFPEAMDYYAKGNPVSVLGIYYKDIRYDTFPTRRTAIYSELLEPIPKIFNHLELNLFINIYILYNKRCYEVFELFYNVIRNTVSLIEYRMAFLERKDCCDCELKVCENYMDYESKKYPIMIGISPYATQNEIIDLVKNRWNYIQNSVEKLSKNGHIEPYKEEKERLSKIRERDLKSKEIEDIVYTNKELSLNELKDAIKEKTGVKLDQGEIGKIRSLSIKRRERK